MAVAKKTPALRYKLQEEDPGSKYESCTIQIGLKKWLRPKWYRILHKTIKSDSGDISEMMAVFALYINHVVNFMSSEEGTRLNPKFFDSLNSNSIRKMFQEIRDGGGLFGFDIVRGKANCTEKFKYEGRSCLIANAIKQHVTNITTNITTHVKDRLVMFYSKVNEGTKKKPMKDVKALVETLMKTAAADNDFNVNFKAGNPFVLLPMLVKINREIENEIDKCRLEESHIPRGTQTFAVLPLRSPGAFSVHYDRAAFIELLNRQIKQENLRRKTQKTGQPKLAAVKMPKDLQSSREIFNKITIFKTFERPRTRNVAVINLRKKFSLSFTTDGQRGSLHYRRKVIEETKLEDKVFTVDAGIDPGLKAFFGCVTVKRSNNVYKNILMKSKNWHYNSGRNKRKQIQEAITGRIDEQMQLERELSKNMSQGYDNYEKFERQKLRHHFAAHSIYSVPKIKRLKWEKQRIVRSMLDMTVNSLCPANEVTRMMYGDGGFSWKGMKGHVSPPLKGLFSAFKRSPNCQVFLTDEYNTTKICSNGRCRKIMKTAKSPHRYQHCKSCGRSSNRDINGADNIREKGKSQHFGYPMPNELTRPQRPANGGPVIVV